MPPLLHPADSDADAIRLLAYEDVAGLGRGGDAMEVDTAHCF